MIINQETFMPWNRKTFQSGCNFLRRFCQIMIKVKDHNPLLLTQAQKYKASKIIRQACQIQGWRELSNDDFTLNFTIIIEKLKKL